MKMVQNPHMLHTQFPLLSLSYIQFSSVQFSRSVVSDSLQPHEWQHARPPCPSPTFPNYIKLFPLFSDVCLFLYDVGMELLINFPARINRALTFHLVAGFSEKS